MPGAHPELLEIILRECAASGAQPWYPSAYANATGVPREPLEASLDQLRHNGLVRLTPWVQNHGQGYQLTPQGAEVLQRPRLLARLRNGDVPEARQPAEPVEEFHALSVSRGEKIRDALLSDSRPIMTQALIAANVAWFLVGLAVFMKAGGEFTNYFAQGGRLLGQVYHDIGSLARTDITVEHEWWRLLSYGFIHGGIMHLFMNMFALYMIGPLLERMWGRAAYLAIFLVSVIGGGAFAVVATPESYLVGASGGICGLLASMMTWLLLNKSSLPGELVAQWQRNILANIVLIAIISFLPGISWAGHLGGGIAGAVIGVPLNLAHFGVGMQRLAGWLGTMIVMIVGVVVFLQDLPAEVGPLDRNHTNLLMAKGDEIARDAVNSAVDMLNGKVKKPEGEAASKLQSKYASSQSKLDQIAGQLSEAHTPAIPEQGKAIKATIAYLEAASAFSSAMKDALGQPGTLTNQQRGDLTDILGRVKDLFGEFNDAWGKMKEAWPEK